MPSCSKFLWGGADTLKPPRSALPVAAQPFHQPDHGGGQPRGADDGNKVRKNRHVDFLLDFSPYMGYNQGGGGKAPRSPLGLGLRLALVGLPQARFYLAFAARTIWAASSGVAAFASISWASVSRNALNSALVMPSAMSSLPFVRGLRPCLTLIIISC
nr:MAG TPA: hypothetical protein [Caudoviricetes sp.]